MIETLFISLLYTTRKIYIKFNIHISTKLDKSQQNRSFLLNNRHDFNVETKYG